MAFDAAIIGGGPAGCSCGQWLRMLGLSCAIIERRDTLGGLQGHSPYQNKWVVALPPETTGHAVARFMEDNLRQLDVPLWLGRGARWVEERPDGGFRVHVTGTAPIAANAVVVASGVEPRSGGVEPNERILIGPGNHIATTEFRGKRVAILGGGDNAFENHAFVRAAGARSITIFARTVRARRQLIDGVPPQDVVIGPYVLDAGSRSIDGQSYDFILIMYGWEANHVFLDGLGLAKDVNGFLRVDHDRMTSRPGIYAIGEVAQMSHPCVVTAMADGVIAAKHIQCCKEAAPRSEL